MCVYTVSEALLLFMRFLKECPWTTPHCISLFHYSAMNSQNWCSVQNKWHHYDCKNEANWQSSLSAAQFDTLIFGVQEYLSPHLPTTWRTAPSSEREREETVLQAGWGWSTTFQPNWVRTVGRRWETERTVARGGVCSLPWIPIVVGAERQEGNHAAEQLYLWGDERGRSHQGLRQSQIHMVTQIYPRLHPPAHTHTHSYWHAFTLKSPHRK